MLWLSASRLSSLIVNRVSAGAARQSLSNAGLEGSAWAVISNLVPFGLHSGEGLGEGEGEGDGLPVGDGMLAVGAVVTAGEDDDLLSPPHPAMISVIAAATSTPSLVRVITRWLAAAPDRSTAAS
jgi:hypothetical protein